MYNKTHHVFRLFLFTCLAALLVSCSGSSDKAEDEGPTYSSLSLSLDDTVEITGGDVWAEPVWDGSNIVVSTETSGAIHMGKYDTDMNVVAALTQVADESDITGNSTCTSAGDACEIADHKHVFLGNHHYIAFSSKGTGDGGYLILKKIDTDLNGVATTAVVDDDNPTNDMVMTDDGTDLIIGKFSPVTAGGHEMFRYNTSLTQVATANVGGPDHIHANGAAMEYVDDAFYIFAPETLAPGDADFLYWITLDADLNETGERINLVEDTGNIGLATSVHYDEGLERFIGFYIKSSTGAGDIYWIVFDAQGNIDTHEKLIEGDHHRPHALFHDGKLYLGYDTGTTTFTPYVAVYTLSYTS
ncbi:MAG: hypothetical protein KDK51_03640 [Deltaproteobacteria bacterium]|nr:hypothetical protein [Deltaproteobacteria bacterium]